MKLSPNTIAALWELRDHIDDPFVYGDLTGWLECQEGTPPYSWPPPQPGTHESELDGIQCPCRGDADENLSTDDAEHCREWILAARWSQANRSRT